MNYRKATLQDVPAIAQIYSDIHTQQEEGLITVGWIRDVYPTAHTAELSVQRGDMFVQEDNGVIVGAAIINQQQVDSYADGHWQHPAPEEEVMVLHTLVISPALARRGYGKDFVAFYEQYALENGCPYLRMDTNAHNTRARALYHSLDYNEIDIVPCVFNGIAGVQLVLLEKKL